VKILILDEKYLLKPRIILRKVVFIAIIFSGKYRYVIKSYISNPEIYINLTLNYYSCMFDPITLRGRLLKIELCNSCVL
jgi:hypothetical protein